LLSFLLGGSYFILEHKSTRKNAFILSFLCQFEKSEPYLNLF